MGRSMNLNLLYGDELLKLYLQKLIEAEDDEIELLNMLADEMISRMSEYDGTVNKAINLLYNKCGDDVSNKLAEIMDAEL